MNDLRSEISPEYSFKSSDKEPGRLVEQTLNIRFREDYDLEAVSSPIILLLETDFGEIVMGSQSYPCSVEISSDGLSKKLTFKAENIG
jgi:hypothetical protein